MSKPKRQVRSIRTLLTSLLDDVMKQGQFVVSSKNFDVYLATLKSAFVKSYDFARFAHRVPMSQANETSFFTTAALRGICEDIIALKFIAQFPKEIRQELMVLEMSSNVRKTIRAQTDFFKRERPFQPVLTSRKRDDSGKEKAQYANIGSRTGLPMINDKLPAVEQMAVKVGLRELYNYLYRVTSETVHFNVHVALRNGWGPLPGSVQFGTKTFCKYYLSLNQTYGVFLFCLMSETFKSELGLDNTFLITVEKLRKELDRELRWPEPVTFEEMNVRPPSPILTAALMVAHLEKTEPEYVGGLRRKLRKRK